MPTEEQLNSFLDRLQPAVEQTAQTLGVAASELWKIGILKQYADGWVNLTAGLALILIPVILAAWLLPKHIERIKKIEDRFWREESKTALIFWFFLFVPILFGFLFLNEAIYHFLVPQWMLIREVLEYMK